MSGAEMSSAETAAPKRTRPRNNGPGSWNFSSKTVDLLLQFKWSMHQMKIDANENWLFWSDENPRIIHENRRSRSQSYSFVRSNKWIKSAFLWRCADQQLQLPEKLTGECWERTTWRVATNVYNVNFHLIKHKKFLFSTRLRHSAHGQKKLWQWWERHFPAV